MVRVKTEGEWLNGSEMVMVNALSNDGASSDFIGVEESEDDFEDSREESESEVSENKSELEDDSEAEDKSESEDFDDDQEYGGGHASGRENSEDIGSGGQDSKDDHVSGVNHDVEGGTSEGGASEGSPASDGGHDSERKDYEVVAESEDDFEDSREESESEVSENKSELEDDSEAEDKSESEGDSESEGESEDESESEEDSAFEDESELENFDDDQEYGGGHASGRENSEDIGSGGQDSKDDHVSGVNHDVEGGTSEGGASEGSPASDGGHDSERKDASDVLVLLRSSRASEVD
ncbi:uncharacterized protein LOC131635103 [Vicia villosa]|uniref:uncharacterized protein LOC131635103 n=1 Tax=Vicia villosa TaxID=3911 RepID=UPI00273C6E87|nr:uncharacterized protein LOC131635103 [Vicia villosa]